MDILEWFVKQCRKIFKRNLLCVLLLGSVQRNDTTPFSDIDVVIVLRKMSTLQLGRLRSVLRNSKELFDCSVICWEELPCKSDDFCLGTHGCYHLELVLKKARNLYGHNVLVKLPSPCEASLRQSVERKVAEYVWWIRRLAVESNRARSLELNYKLNSRLIKMLRDTLYLCGHAEIMTCCVSDAFAVFLKEYGTTLTQRERRVLVELGDSARISINTSDMSEEYLITRLAIANKLHGLAVKAVRECAN